MQNVIKVEQFAIEKRCNEIFYGIIDILGEIHGKRITERRVETILEGGENEQEGLQNPHLYRENR